MTIAEYIGRLRTLADRLEQEVRDLPHVGEYVLTRTGSNLTMWDEYDDWRGTIDILHCVHDSEPETAEKGAKVK